ncbi:MULTISPECIES: beta-L-arabinofuranosidase domain-containing protein [unclassified Parabacteroides]|uniref:glycoside hydrolase family 127 protein n=1 Tax=unclassified Parabacteroides TaxID=2649774 RepID=UPI0024738136|nr:MULTISPECIES: beta-L-arabinofuranosidase domain-containing protein [unclassified Parabacteroides]
MKKILLTTCIIAAFACNKVEKAETYSNYPIEAVNLNHVQLSDNFWLPRIESIQNKVIRYAFDKCEAEGRLENFVIAGQVIKGGEGCARGKMPFDDTDVYKTLEGLAYSLINSPNPTLEAYADSVITIIAQGQEPDGYLTTWRTINPMKPTSDWVTPGPRWSHLDISHELYNSGHLFEAAAAYYWATGKRNMLDIALKNADLLLSVFGDNTYNAVPGHQIVETGLIKLYQITGKEEYLHLSKKFLDLRGDSSVREIWGAENIQDHLPVLEQEEAVGHAVRAVYMYAGMTDIAAIYQDAEYLAAVHKLWENMVNKKMYITGGIGSRHHLEMFGDNYELPNLTAYSETCASIGSVYWNERLFRLTGDAKYYDIIERTMYNALIAGISLEGTEFFYPNPLESDGEYAFNKGACTREAWFDCSCCPTNLIRFIPYVPNLIYATHDNDIYINLFMSNKASIPGKAVTIKQETNYPWDGKIKIHVSANERQAFALKIRIPEWVVNKPVPSSLYQYADTSDDTYKVWLDGKEIKGELTNGYFEIKQDWPENSLVELDLPMQVRHVVANEQVTDLKGLMSIEYGPLVYCAEEIDNKGHFEQIRFSTKDHFSVESAPELLGGINSIKKKEDSKEQSFIPYYTWSNRGIGKMKVWFAQE